MIHLVDQIHTLGPLYLHSMFPNDHFLAIQKAYVRNYAHPEGSIMEGYTIEEVVEWCADYVKDGKLIGLHIPLHEGILRGRGRMGQKTFIDRDYTLVSEAHFSVLQQLTIDRPYIDEHLSELWRDNTGHTDSWIMKEHQRVFTTLLMEKTYLQKIWWWRCWLLAHQAVWHHGKHMTLMNTLITHKKKTRVVLPKIVAFVSRLLIHYEWKPRTMGTYRTYENSITAW
jgi:hypothetical protein